MTQPIVKNTISNGKAIFLYSLVSFFLFFEMAIQVSPSVMAPELMNDLNIGTFGLGIMSGIYFYTYTAMQIPSGMLFDQHNPRAIITLSILTCVIGTLLFALSQNIYVGCLARLLMGSGSAFAFVSVLVVTADLFKSTYFATMTGITQALAALGAMTGQMPISLMVTHIGWRNTLFLLFAVGLVLAIVIWKLLKYERTMAELHKASDPSHVKLNLKNIVASKQTWYVALYSCLLWAPMSSFTSLWGVPFLIRAYHFEQAHAAFLCSLMWLGLAAASPLLGIISTHTNNRKLPLAISALVGAVSFYLVLKYQFSPIIVGTLLFLAGAACSGQALSFTVVKENNSASAKGTAIAFNNMAVVISGALFQPLIGKLLDGNRINDIATFKNVLLIVFAAYVISFLIALFLIKEPEKSLNSMSPM